MQAIGGNIPENRNDREYSLWLEQPAADVVSYLRGVAKALPGLLFEFRLRPNGTVYIPFATDNFEEITGLDPQLLVDDAEIMFERIHPDDVPVFRNLMAESARDMTNAIIEFRVLHPERGWIWLESRSAPEIGADGSVLWHGMSFDITARKQAEESLRLASTVLKNMGEGVIVTDAGQKILTTNPAFTAITGYAEEEAVGKQPNFLRSGRHDREFYREMWDGLLEFQFWRGELWNRRKNGEIYPQWTTIVVVKDASGAISNYIATISDMSRIKQSESQVEHLEHYDSQTDLPNRQLFRSLVDKAMTEARAERRNCRIVHIDLKGIAAVNESFGYAAGDELLASVARRIKRRLKIVDTLARLGGDQFAILLERTDSRDRAIDLASQLNADIAEPFAVGSDREVLVSASCGIAQYPEDGATVDALLQHAHSASQDAKRQGFGRVALYSSPLTEAATARINLVANLRRAIKDEEFELHYQPLVSIAGGRIVGAEALARWMRPGETPVPPDVFISIAEETGLILPLGDWVLNAACRQMSAWRGTGMEIGVMAINLSPLQFKDPNLVDRIEGALHRFSLPGQCIELEITEGALMGGGVEIEERLAQLRRLGVSLAIDDFGTGYSSLSYLKRLPIDKVKIDRSFVADLPHDEADRQITTAIVSMGKSLGLRVLAEGVETKAQLAFLHEVGCEFVQGYLFSRAVPAAQFEREFPHWRKTFSQISCDRA